MKPVTTALLLLSIVLFSQAHAASEVKDPSQENISLTKQLLTTTQEEVKLLKNELQLVRSYQDNLLSTVYWSLGTLVTIAGLLVGIGWFANFRIYERDKVALTKDLKLILEEETRKIERTIQFYKDKDIPVLIDNSSKSHYSSLKTEFQNGFTRIQRQILSIQYDMLEIEHEKWISKKVFANALRNSTSMLDVSIQMDSKYELANSLDLMQEDLKQIIQCAETPPDADDISGIVRLLGKVDSGQAILVGSIKSLLTKIKS